MIAAGAGRNILNGIRKAESSGIPPWETGRALRNGVTIPALDPGRFRLLHQRYLWRPDISIIIIVF